MNRVIDIAIAMDFVFSLRWLFLTRDRPCHQDPFDSGTARDPLSDSPSDRAFHPVGRASLRFGRHCPSIDIEWMLSSQVPSRQKFRSMKDYEQKIFRKLDEMNGCVAVEFVWMEQYMKPSSRSVHRPTSIANYRKLR
jgi:hypothetical protein